MRACLAAGTVAVRRPLGSLVWMTLTVPGWPGARPGQFALLQAGHSACFLGRALSVADQDGEEVSFLIAPIGSGTRELCGLAPGSSVSVLGPLGNGFDLAAMGWGTPDGRADAPEAAGPAGSGLAGRLVLVGGGVGVAPFPLLLVNLATGTGIGPTSDRRPGGSGGTAVPEVLVLLGFRDQGQAEGAAPVRATVDKLLAAGVQCRLELVAEDGSVGRPERVSELLAREVRPGDHVAVCGPEAMAAAVWQACSGVPGVKAWFSLEAGMACGVGSCHGCTITLAGGETARVCHEGPVFSGEALFAVGTTFPRASEGRRSP
jgi:dihydroorotate dehydrogenase electron transfer subunit